MNDELRQAGDAGHEGITVEDLPGIMRELFDQCVADACAVVGPHEDFEAFVDVLWQQVSSAFSLLRRDWPTAAPAPWPAMVDQRRGLAEALLEGTLAADDLPF